MTSNSDILSKLAEEARRLHVARKLPADDPLPWEWVSRVQEDFRRFLEETGMSQSQVVRKMGAGFSGPVISSFLAMKKDSDYIGDRDRIVRGINNFMEIHARRANAPRPAGWIETEVARRMLVLIGKTIELRAMGLIYSDAGRGKTMTLEAARGIYPGSVIVRILSGTRSPAGLAKLLAKQFKFSVHKSTFDIQMELIDQLKGTDRALMIDEAHQLNPKALEFLRDLHDACEIPIILVGTKKIDEATADTDQFFGQLTSRIALRYDVTEQLHSSNNHKPKPLHSAAEIEKMFKQDKVRLTADGIHTLTRIANLEGFGGLRLCKQVVFVAAEYAGDKAIDAGLILKVLRTMHGLVHGVTRITRAIDESKVAVA